MFTPLTLITAALMAAPAAAQDAPEEPAPSEEAGEPTGYRDVELFDGGPTRMEDKRDYKRMIILGPTFFPMGAKLRYQRLLSDRLSVFVGGGYGTRKNWLFTDVDMTRYSMRFGVDLHPIGNGLHGFYVGPRVRYRSWSLSWENDEELPEYYSLSTFTADGVIGWRWVWDPGFSLGLGGGAGYSTMISEDTVDSEIVDLGVIEGTRFAGEFTLGWAF